jgi:hypothetical protein
MAQRIVDNPDLTNKDLSGDDDLITENVNPAVPEMPEKFKGKTVEDILASYENLEKELGRKANELGELRRVSDQLITRDLQKTQNESPAVTEEDIDTDAFLENPVEAVTKIVQKALKPIEASTAETKREATLKALQQKHPKMMDTVADTEFQEWVMASAGRQLLWGQASQGDYDVADELFTEWETKQAAKGEASTASQDQNKNELADAVAINRGTANEAIADGNGARKPTYSRAKLIQLQIENPQRYREMQPEIMAAYAEKRVI